MFGLLVSKESGPDGVEAWCVAVAACIINFVIAGMQRLSATLYVLFIDTFQIDRRNASLPFSVRSLIRNLLGPVIGVLGQKYGIRPVVITGAIVSSFGAAACFYAQDIIWIAVFWGGLSGIGAALASTLNQAVIGQHFKKYKSTAAGMALSGGCASSFVFPALTEYLVFNYGLAGSFLFLSGILMHVLPAALIMKKPSWLCSKRPPSKNIFTLIDNSTELSDQKDSRFIQNAQNFEERYRKYDIDEKMNLEYQQKNSKTSQQSDQILRINSVFERQINTQLLWENKTLVKNLLTKNLTIKCPHPNNHIPKCLLNESIVTEIEDLFKRIYKDAMTGKNSLERDSAENLKSVYCVIYFLNTLFEKGNDRIKDSFHDSENENVSKILDELWNIHVSLHKNINYTLFCSEKNTFNTKKNRNSNSFSTNVKNSLKLFTKPMFVLISLSRSAHFLTYSPIITAAVDFATDKGLPEEDGKYVIGALALGDLLGRSSLGWITDKGYVTLPKFLMFGMMIQAAFTMSLAVVDSRITFLSNIAIFALLTGSIFVRHPVLISRYMESNEQAIAMGSVNFFSGFLASVIPSYIGYFRDVRGSYNGILYINSFVSAVVGFLWILEPYFVKLSQSSSERKNYFQSTL